MSIGTVTPLLDFFRRGEVARDVRLMAAQGVVAPRPVEQLGLLALLTRDQDAEVSSTAEATLARLPAGLVAAFLAKDDVPVDLRAFFAARGIEPTTPPLDEDVAPLLDADDTLYEEDNGSAEEEGARVLRVSDMTVPQRLKAAMKGPRELRAILVRDTNRMVALAVLSSPKLTEMEVESFARLGSVSEDVLRTIGQTRAWTKSYAIVAALLKNAKTPVAVSLNLLQRLNDRDVRNLSTDRNVPEPLRTAARRRVVNAAQK